MTDGEIGDVVEQPAIAAPGFFFTGEDALQLTSWNALASVVLTVTGRFVHPSGRVEVFSERHTPNTDRSAKTAFYGRGVGWLTDLSIIASGAAPLRGQTYVRVDVVRGSASTSLVLSTLLQGYVTATKRVAYPTSPLEDSLRGQGAMRSITGTDPAAGAEISETVPTGARWKLRAMRATLVTSAIVANRTATLLLDDGAAIYWTGPGPANQAASLSEPYSWSVSAANQTALSGPGPSLPLPDLAMLAGHRFRSSTIALDVGDNWSAPQYLVEEWLEAL